MPEKTDVEALLLSGRTVQLKPKGYSMYPLIVPGRDEAIISPADVSKLRRGDVILYRRDSGILVLHRIWKVRDGFYMVGDNQKEIEGPLSAEHIKGVLTGFVRKGKRVSVKNPAYVILSRIWLIMRPLRPAVSKTAASIKRLFKKVNG